MDATTLNTIVGIIGIISTAIGIGVGFIGYKQLSAATEIRTKNKNSAKADNGATIHQDSSITINNGLSNRDVIDLADTTTRKTMGKVISDIMTPEKFLKLDIAAYSIAPLSYADSSDTYIFEFFTKVKGEKFTLRFKKEHFTSNNTEVKCMITDLNRENLKLYTFSGSLGILPQSVYKYLNLSGQEHIEVTLRPDQVVAGRTGNGSIILASIEPEYSWKCLYIKVALYTPLEVTL